MLTKWDYRFLTLACNVANWSKDPDVKVGALVVSPDRRSVGWGFNGFPRGVEDNAERLDHKPMKNFLMVHAELNAILNARTSLEGWTMYVTRHPCSKCSQAVIQSGIRRVVFPHISEGSSWVHDCLDGTKMLTEAGVGVDLWVPSDEWYEEFDSVLR